MKQNFLLACYNGFYAKIEYSEEKQKWIGYVLDMEDLLMFSDKTLDGVLVTFHMGIEEYLKENHPGEIYKDNIDVINLIRHGSENHCLTEIIKEIEEFEEENKQ